MDTRNKIVEVERALAFAQEARARRSPVKVVTGYFDVVVAEHVRRLREIKKGSAALLVVVLDPPEPLLSGRARAELVAALGVVDYVVPAEEPAAMALLNHFQPDEIVREEPADLLRARRLSEHVHDRQQQ